ncbi:MAG: hypothetical protein HYT82_00805 [Candidatus Harrisonbacteria bacterium]|nr:hypothetical protein [Candidatus Harrisonbacteria bacterium]
MYAIFFAVVMLVAAITFIIAYSIGYEQGLGKPKPQSHFKPRTVYAPFSSTTLATPRKSGGYDERNLALLKSEDGAIIFAELEEQLPDGKRVLVIPCIGGKIRFWGFNPKKEESPPQHVDVIA